MTNRYRAGALLATLGLALCLNACGGGKKPGYDQSDLTADGVRYTSVSVQSLPGWSHDDVREALPAIKKSCARLATLPDGTAFGPTPLRGTIGDWRPICRQADQLSAGNASSADVRRFIESSFQAFQVSASNDPQGLFTGYYESRFEASRTRGNGFETPVYGLPSGWARTGQGRPERRAIENGALDGKAPVILWARDPVDLFMLQIQGSGMAVLPDGSIQRVGYAGDNGHKFVGIGRLIRERGLGDGGSMPTIRVWLRENPVQGKALMSENPRYIFFRLIDGDGPIGAQGVALTPRRSLAVDKAYVPLGSLIWVSTSDPHGRRLERLMVAQDTGSAIKGPVRGDFFWGSGEEALYFAGSMKSDGRVWLLLPKSGLGDPRS